jgi:NDP-sugar pyrophosphorylase family protein
MKAMVLAAGLGTRLRPLTNDRPKALVEINGRALLEITLARLREFGVREVIINTHHFASKIADYLLANNNFGMRIEISAEDVLLDTGGGLNKAAHFFLRDDEPFFLHNVDVLSNIDLADMLRFHRQHAALASLAVQKRKTSRYLLFDGDSRLYGRRVANELDDDGTAPSTSMGEVDPLAFCGIHVISPRFLRLMVETGVFSIIDVYLRLAAARENILAFRADRYYWRDLGRPESVAQASHDLAQGVAK